MSIRDGDGVSWGECLHCGHYLRTAKPLLIGQSIGKMNPREHFIRVDMGLRLNAFSSLKQGGIEVRFRWKTVRAVENRRPAFSAEATRVAGAAFAGNRLVSGELPRPILLPDKCGEGRGCRLAAAFAVAMSDPIGFAGQFEGTCPAQTAPLNGRLHFTLHNSPVRFVWTKPVLPTLDATPNLPQ